MESVTVRIRHVDLADRRAPQYSGRYVYLPDLLVALREARTAVRPLDALEELLCDITKESRGDRD